MATYQEITPATYQIPIIIDSIVRVNYNNIVPFIWNELLNFNAAGTSNSRVFYGNTTGLDKPNKENNLIVVYTKSSFIVFYLKNIQLSKYQIHKAKNFLFNTLLKAVLTYRMKKTEFILFQ